MSASAADRIVAVVGGGPAGLMAAETVSAAGHAVTVYDRMPSVGRKFLMAGRGGLNLTHSEALERFVSRYPDAVPAFRDALDRFTPERLCRWSEDLGQRTFVGSSGRVFPEAMKASPLLRAWLKRLAGLNVRFAPRHRWTGWTPDGALSFDTAGGPVVADADATVLALGGASWPNLGSDGGWTLAASAVGLDLVPFRPANVGVTVAWTEKFRDRFEGEPLKNVSLRHGDQSTRGDAVITRTGLEGGAVYGLSGVLRDAIAADGQATLRIALRPDVSTSNLTRRLGARPPKQSVSTWLRRTLHLAPVTIGLLHESLNGTGTVLGSLPTDALAVLVNDVPVRLTGVAPLGRAISTAGGLAFSNLDENFMLIRRPGTFVAGEMLDWEAPTGGYLLQACYATGAAAGQGVLRWLETRRPPSGRGPSSVHRHVGAGDLSGFVGT